MAAQGRRMACLASRVHQLPIIGMVAVAAPWGNGGQKTRRSSVCLGPACHALVPALGCPLAHPCTVVRMHRHGEQVDPARHPLHPLVLGRTPAPSLRLCLASLRRLCTRAVRAQHHLTHVPPRPSCLPSAVGGTVTVAAVGTQAAQTLVALAFLSSAPATRQGQARQSRSQHQDTGGGKCNRFTRRQCRRKR